jgi:transposase
LKSERERMDMIAAYNDLGSYRGAAAICGVDHKTVKRAVAGQRAERPATARPHNYDVVADVVAQRVGRTSARISAKRLLPEARAAGYTGSARNFRRLVAKAKRAWRANNHRGRRPGVWAPGEVLVIDWGVEGGLHIFCAVMAFSRWRFVRFAADERATTTLEMLARCFEALGAVPKVVLADRMGCLKGAVVANIVVPTPAYVRFATHYGFRPDFCEAADPESKELVSYCTFLLGSGGRSIGEARAHLLDEPRVARRWRVEKPSVPVVGLVGSQETGFVPRLYRGRVHAQALRELWHGELALGA